MTIKPNDIATLVEIFAASNWDELHVEIDGLQLFLSTDPNARLTSSAALAPPALAAEAQPGSTSRGPVVPSIGAATAKTGSTATGSAHSDAAVENTPAAVPSNWVAVTAPNLGTFYRSPKPGAASFVEEGQVIETGHELCLIEVMKLFTSVKAAVAGTVRRICVKDAQLVEFGQTLLYIERQ